ncbi:MAG: hypothetical protein IIC82_06325 [Chloroflexi bacterium]|nr:hypothetical protein [Chloroflexota bacterium]
MFQRIDDAFASWVGVLIIVDVLRSNQSTRQGISDRPHGTVVGSHHDVYAFRADIVNVLRQSRPIDREKIKHAPLRDTLYPGDAPVGDAVDRIDALRGKLIRALDFARSEEVANVMDA